jgi:hypothetical protein
MLIETSTTLRSLHYRSASPLYHRSLLRQWPPLSTPLPYLVYNSNCTIYTITRAYPMSPISAATPEMTVPLRHPQCVTSMLHTDCSTNCYRITTPSLPTTTEEREIGGSLPHPPHFTSSSSSVYPLPWG